MKRFILYLVLLCSPALVVSQNWPSTHHINKASGLYQNTVFALEEDSLGAVWIGTPGGLNRFNGFEVAKLDSIAETVLFLHRSGRYMYCLTLAAFYRIDIVDLTWKKHTFPEKDYYQIRYLNGGFVVHSNRTLTSTLFDFKLNVLEDDALDLQSVPNCSPPLTPDSLNGWSFQAGPNGAFRVKGQDTIWLTKSFCTQIKKYRNRMLIAYHEGLMVITLAQNGFEVSQQFNYDKAECLMIDRNQNLWVGTAANGAFMIHKNILESRYFGVTEEGKEVPCWEVLNIDGINYTATTVGLRRLDKPLDNDPYVIQSSGIAINAGVHFEGTTVIGSSLKGIMRWRRNTFETVYFNTSEALDNSIIDIIPNPTGFVACSKRSFIQLDRAGKFLFSKTYTDCGLLPYVMSIYQNTEGYMVATTVGMHQLDSEFNVVRSWKHEKARVFCGMEYELCVSMDGGLFRLGRDSLFKLPFPDNQLLGIVDQNWIMSTTAVYHRTENRVRKFDVTDGFPISEYNQGCFSRNPDGNILFGGLGGVFEFSPHTVKEERFEPHVLFKVAGTDISSGVVGLDYDQGTVVVDIEPIILSDRNAFDLKLVGHDGVLNVVEPIQIQKQLPFGETLWTLHINNLSNGVTTYQNITFFRAYPFWQKLWFQISMVMAFLLFMVGIYVLIKYVQTKRVLRLELAQKKVNEERLRISSELHDNIGARLTHIISSLDMEMYRSKENATPLENINAFARETMGQLRETIWAVSDKTVFFSEFALRVEQACNQAQELTKRTVTFSNESTVEFEFNPVQTINYFRIFQEALNNAIKYSKAETIAVSLTSTDRMVELTISDNGIGFNTASTKFGTGLKGMKRRAAESGGAVTIESSEGAGTKVCLRFKSE